jgi:hypothetical protein
LTTLRFAGTDHKTFTPISAAVANLPNGPGTLVALFKKTVVGSTDTVAVQSAGQADIFHSLAHGGGPLKVLDDDGIVGPVSTTSVPDDTTNWWWNAVDWGSGAAVERMHWRNQSTLAGWTHDPSSAANGGLRTGPGTSGWVLVGWSGNATATKDLALVAIWPGTRFSDSDYGDWRKTSDLWNHSLGHPSFLVELNAATPVDLVGGSTYSALNSSGTTFVGADPANFVFDGFGVGISGSGSASGPGRLGMFTPQMRSDAWF